MTESKEKGCKMIPTKMFQIHKCDICGNIIEIVHEGMQALVCCKVPMNLMEEKTADSTTEKHVPVITKLDGKVKVTVGSTLHPMMEKHYIEWIQIIADGVSQRKFLKPGDAPEAVFETNAVEIIAREYCNLHGLWRS